jgi:hypothetical protein
VRISSVALPNNNLHNNPDAAGASDEASAYSGKSRARGWGLRRADTERLTGYRRKRAAMRPHQPWAGANPDPQRSTLCAYPWWGAVHEPQPHTGNNRYDDAGDHMDSGRSRVGGKPDSPCRHCHPDWCGYLASRHSCDRAGGRLGVGNRALGLCSNRVWSIERAVYPIWAVGPASRVA